MSMIQVATLPWEPVAVGFIGAVLVLKEVGGIVGKLKNGKGGEQATFQRMVTLQEQQRDLLQRMAEGQEKILEHSVKSATAWGYDKDALTEKAAEAARSKIEPDIRAAKHEVIGAVQKVRDDIGWLKRGGPPGDTNT